MLKYLSSYRMFYFYLFSILKIVDLSFQHALKFSCAPDQMKRNRITFYSHNSVQQFVISRNYIFIDKLFYFYPYSILKFVCLSFQNSLKFSYAPDHHIKRNKITSFIDIILHNSL